jgi:hypothetical protein
VPSSVAILKRQPFAAFDLEKSQRAASSDCVHAPGRSSIVGTQNVSNAMYRTRGAA